MQTCMNFIVVTRIFLNKCHTYVSVFIIRLTHANVWKSEALQLHVVYKKLYFILQVTRESVSVLQVMCAASEHAVKSKVYHSTKLYWEKKNHSFVAVGTVTRAAHS